jgi:outer membrane protein OmpA-like peptidoglycan-associated protein
MNERFEPIPASRSIAVPVAPLNHRGSGPGAPLPLATRSWMELAFGHDFSGVRIHAEDSAARATRAVGARAFTVGQDVFFGRGEFSPSTREGRRLIAHELAHTVQQLHQPVARGRDQVSTAGAESEASAAAHDAANGRGAAVQSRTPVRIARERLPSGKLDLSDHASPMLAAAIGSTTVDGFALGKSELSAAGEAELRRTAAQILTLLEQYPASTVRILGHADRVGTEERNFALGKARAESAKAVLISAGIPEELLSTESLGETQLAVPTRDERAEPRNRRIEVRFQPNRMGAGLFSGRLTPPSMSSGSPPPQPPQPPGGKRRGGVGPIIGDDFDDRPRPPYRPKDTTFPDWMWEKEVPGGQGDRPQKSILETFHEKVTDPILKPLVSPFSKDTQKWLLDKAHDGIEAGVKKGFEAAVDSVTSDSATRDALKNGFDAALKQKPSTPNP